MKVYNTRPVSLTMEVLLIKTVLFFGPLKYLNLVFQSNQHFETKEFVDWPVSEELDNVRSFLFYGHEVL